MAERVHGNALTPGDMHTRKFLVLDPVVHGSTRDIQQFRDFINTKKLARRREDVDHDVFTVERAPPSLSAMVGGFALVGGRPFCGATCPP